MPRRKVVVELRVQDARAVAVVLANVVEAEYNTGSDARVRLQRVLRQLDLGIEYVTSAEGPSRAGKRVSHGRAHST